MECYEIASGEPCKGLDRLSAHRRAQHSLGDACARDKIDLAAALVGAVAGVHAEAGGLAFPDPASAAWLELERRLDLVTKGAATLGSRIPRIRDPRFARPVAHGLDALLGNITVGYNALELAIGDGLAALEIGRRAMHLKYSNIGDYAREEFGLNASTAAKKARLARKLQDRPLVREAVQRGEITLRKAEVIVPVAVGDQQTHWILRAKELSVRALKKEVDAPRDPEDEEFATLVVGVTPEERPFIQEGLRWGAIDIGHRSRTFQRVEAWGQEYFGAHAIPPDDGCDAEDVRLRARADDEMDSLKEFLEQESRLWAGPGAIGPLKAPEFSGEIGPWRIDAGVKGFI